ncbi:MAG TPA: hypothetical protein DCZ43_10940, partial [candidate division Zixibacteria bacterium]|nr:hypothetical protein [candidate division Zixibacteria bacterium]
MKKLLFVTMALLMVASFAWGQDRQGTISGTILAQTDSVPQPLSGAHIVAFQLNGQMPVANATANAEGHYTLHVPFGQYQIHAEAYHFNSAWYNNVPERAQATTVAVTVDTNATGIDFLMIHVTPPPPPLQGTISGIVTGMQDSNVVPLRYAHVLAFATNGNMPAGAAFADSLGQYTLHLNYGQYVVRAEAMNLVSLWYNNVPERSQATVLAVGDSSNPTGINFLLLPPAPPPPPPGHGTISGTVLGQADSNTVPLPAMVYAYPVNSDHPAAMVMTDRSGNYILHVTFGGYQIKAEAYHYVPLWYNNVPERAQATTVAVADSVNPTGINFLLQHEGPPPPPPAPVSGISGVITNAFDNSPIRGAMVTAIKANNHWMHRMV